jgi:hypothetical protein
MSGALAKKFALVIVSEVIDERGSVYRAASNLKLADTAREDGTEDSVSA